MLRKVSYCWMKTFWVFIVLFIFLCTANQYISVSLLTWDLLCVFSCFRHLFGCLSDILWPLYILHHLSNTSVIVPSSLSSSPKHHRLFNCFLSERSFRAHQWQNLINLPKLQKPVFCPTWQKEQSALGLNCSLKTKTQQEPSHWLIGLTTIHS